MPKPTKYERQVPARRVTPPHVSLKSLRRACGLTIDELAARVETTTGRKAPSRGALSAIENGVRGASGQLLADIAAAYGLAPEEITTTYLPRVTPDPNRKSDAA